METTTKSLAWIQGRLKAPKGQFNKFGGYRYRSCEDILEAVKPLLQEAGATLVVSDEVVLIGDRFYLKATARLTDAAGRDWSAVAYAREPLQKKGMDESQITGSASSYARKYALNGLFSIDDTRDADALGAAGGGDDDTLALALSEVRSARDVSSLSDIYNRYREVLGAEPRFMSALTERKKEVGRG